MKKIDIKIFQKEECGVIKKVNGGNLAPPLNSEKAGCNLRQKFKELHLPLTRLHDAPLENGGMKLVDIPQIFANFHADENDPRNYYFDQTDDYIKNCIECNTGIIYRLGVSIEHSMRKYFIYPPENIDKWINICDHIIRHYTEGWACGFNFFNMKYWEIWNEPEVCDADGCRLMWGGTLPEFNLFYVKAATELKKRFPQLKFGGPAHAGYGDNGYGHLTRNFIRCCAEHQAPLDFYSYHCYDQNPFGNILKTPAMVRRDLDDAGFKETEIHLNEWHYFPGDWNRFRHEADYMEQIHREMKGLSAAAYICTVLIGWQDTPLDLGCYYTVTPSVWGIFRAECATPAKAYYGLKAFGELCAYPKRLKTKSSVPEVVALAGADTAGRQAVLVSAFKTGPFHLGINSEMPLNPGQCEVLLLDDQHNLDPVPFELAGNTIQLELKSESTVLLIKIGKEIKSIG